MEEINSKVPALDNIPDGELNIVAILNWAYVIMGMVAVVGIIFGAVVWTTSRGDSAKVEKGRNAVLYSVIGLFIVMSAAAITNLVAGAASGK